jgi:hypothetical protein
LLTLVLVVLPALVFMRRSPEEMGLQPDGMDAPSAPVGSKAKDDMKARLAADVAVWTWREVIRTKAFWIICFIYGMANVGIAGLNLHVFAYVTDIGFSPLVAATVLSIIASTQLGSTMVWGVISERMDIRYSSSIMFWCSPPDWRSCLPQARWCRSTSVFSLWHQSRRWLGAAELIWATNFGRISLGMNARQDPRDPRVWRRWSAVLRFRPRCHRQLRIVVLAFVVALIVSALLSLAVRAPRKNSAVAS